MKFGPIPVAESNGVVLAHAIKYAGISLSKGEWISACHIADLQAAGVDEIIGVRIEAGDTQENEAASRLAVALAGAHVLLDRADKGRCNLRAGCDGLLIIDVPSVDRVNMVDESITIATLQPFVRVVAGQLIATAKIIPYAVSEATLGRAVAAAGDGSLSVAPFCPLRVGVVSTLLPNFKRSIVEKALRHLEGRLAPAGGNIIAEERTPHEAAPVAEALDKIQSVCDVIVIFGATAITDRCDVVPSAIEKAGGCVEQFGMPVEPGNLLLLGSLPGLGSRKPVIGAPSCARSPKENGFDFVLDRILAGIPVRGEDIKRMGVGGLLLESVIQLPHEAPV